MANPSKWYSIFNLKCPRCHTGNLFFTSSFSFNKPFDMPDRCPHCDLNLMPEPGYYYGAMFISYIFTGWLFIGIIAVLHWVFDWSLAASFGALLLFILIFFVYFFRLSRSLWINMNVKYDPKATTNNGHK